MDEIAVIVTIGGVSYPGLTDYQIRQSAGAVSSISVSVDVTGKAKPSAMQRITISLGGTLVFGGIIDTVNGPEWNTGNELPIYEISAQSNEVICNRRLVKRNWYNKYVHEIINDIYADYLIEEGITLGAISTTTVQIKAYRKNNESVSDIMRDLCDRVGAASWYLSPDKKLYFKVQADFSSATVPELLIGLKKSEAPSGLRTVQTVQGASSRILGTSVNGELLAEIATASGTSGKIEAYENDSSIHNAGAAEDKADSLILAFSEAESTITCQCHDLAASLILAEWSLNEPGIDIVGDFVVVDRTIAWYNDKYLISLTLKNRNFFVRSGYSWKKVKDTADEANDAIADIYADDKLTPAEKISERARWLQLVEELAAYDARATSYGITTEKTSYDEAFQDLADYLSGGTSWTTGYPLWLSDSEMSVTTDIDGGLYPVYWNDYEAARIALDGAIAASIKTEAREASVSLRLSTRSATWNRALVVTPEDLTASSKYADGTNYLGIFQTAFSHDGETYFVAYTSAAPESSHVYEIPALMDVGGTMYHVVSIREILFDPTGLINKSTEYISLTADVSVAPVHFGPLATPPASGMQANDDYFDTRASISGGGKLYYWTGSAWVEMTTAHPQYFAAVSANMTAMIDWCNDNAGTIGDVSAFITALFENIIAQTAMIAKIATSTVYSAALCDDGVTQRMTIDLDNAILTARSADQSKTIKLFDSVLRSTEGANVLDHEGQSLIWRLASTLTELARIQYDPATAKIRLSSAAVPFTFAGTWIMGTFGAYSEKDTEEINEIVTSEFSDGRSIAIYTIFSTNEIRNRIRSIAGTWGDYSVIEANASKNISIYVFPDDTALCAYSNYSGALVYQERTRATNGVWTSTANIGSGSSFSSLVPLTGGEVLFLTGLNTIHERTREANGHWGDPVEIFTNVIEPRATPMDGGKVLCTYRNYSSHYLRARVRDATGAWGSEENVDTENIASSFHCVRMLPDGRAISVCQDDSNQYLRRRIRSVAGTWGTSALIENSNSRYPSISILLNGNLVAIYSDGYTSKLREKIDSSAYTTIPLKTAYAPLGMEIGENANGIYIRIPLGIGVGIQICRGWNYLVSDGSATLTQKTINLPAAMVGATADPMIQGLGYKTSAPTSRTDAVGGSGLVGTWDVPSRNDTSFNLQFVHKAAIAAGYYMLFSYFFIGWYTE